MDFTQAYREHYPAVLAFLRRRVPAERAEDLAAETFARAWRNFETVKGPVLPWFYGVARNVMREYYRKESSTPELDTIDDHDSVGVDFSPNVDLSLDINRALLTLGTADREILTLHAWEGLSAAEIAATLNLSAVNARVRLHRARTRLAEALEKTS
ncbi:RNA polymerase sigma factor [Corynebacterium phocae]|uniref:RNA polymerase sigma factor n=1 Tax=Corynebacterium phocae TaxID=161895 RepID=UPI001FE90A0E|nr:sigma-70 family RNA polymerase sigma factor [Corynebacterium phocae]